MFYFPKLSSDICKGVVGLELVACQTWFSCKALAASSFPSCPIGLPFSCPWRRDGRTMRSLDRQWKRGKRDDFLMGNGSRAVWLQERKMLHSWTQQLNTPSVSGKVFSYSFLSFLSLPALILNSPSWGTFSVSPHSPFPPTISRLTGRPALWSTMPLRVRQHFLSVPEARSASIRGRPEPAPLSVCEVHLLCSVTPLTTPIWATLGLSKLELTMPPHPLKICTTDVPQRLTSAPRLFISLAVTTQIQTKKRTFLLQNVMRIITQLLTDYKRDVMGKKNSHNLIQAH